MRAICESCSHPQPPDWRPGNLCIWCGRSVRRDVRCFWCVKWTPAAKYCRTCGAETVEPEAFGAARMLKGAGTDRFTIPKLLAEIEPDQIENFGRIYQRHAAIAAHHVRQVEFLQSYLTQYHWAALLEDKLLAELPWSEERLGTMAHAAHEVPENVEGLSRAQAIYKATPAPITRSLAVLTRLALEDWSVFDEAYGLLSNVDATIRTEAALAMSHWRVIYGLGLSSSIRRALIDALRHSRPSREVTLRLVLLGEAGEGELPQDDFGTALATGDVDRLSTAARTGDPLQRYAAARTLIRLDVIEPVKDVLPPATIDRQIELIHQLAMRKKPAFELHDTLFALAEETETSRVHRQALDLICRGCPPANMLRIARAARGDSSVYQALLQRSQLTPSELDELGLFLIGNGFFQAGQWGMADVAKEGRMPADFVQRRWLRSDRQTRIELIKFAEMQLGGYRDQNLHRLVVGAAFNPDEVEVQSQAWTSLYRWYNSFGYPRWRPVAIESASIHEFFGTAGQLLTDLSRLLEGREILRVTLHRDDITNLLNYPDENALPLFSRYQKEVRMFVREAAAVMRDPSIDLMIRLACVNVLGFLGTNHEFGPEIAKLLQTFAGTELDLQSNRSLRRIESVLEIHDTIQEINQ